MTPPAARPPRGRRRPSPSEEAARLPAARAGDIGFPARASSARAPLLAFSPKARWPGSWRSAPRVDRGSLGSAPGGRQRSASLRCCCCCCCWAVSATPGDRVGDQGGPGGEGAWTTEASTGPPCEYQPTCGGSSSDLQMGPEHNSRLAQDGAFHLRKTGVPARIWRRGLGRSGTDKKVEGFGPGYEWGAAGTSRSLPGLGQ